MQPYRAVNGDYERSSEVCNGRAIYTKVGNAATRCVWCTQFTCFTGPELLYMCPLVLCMCLCLVLLYYVCPEVLYMSS